MYSHYSNSNYIPKRKVPFNLPNPKTLTSRTVLYMALKHVSMMWNPSYMLVHLGPFLSFELLQSTIFSLGLQIFKKLYIQFCTLLFSFHICGESMFCVFFLESMIFSDFTVFWLIIILESIY